MAQTGRRKTAKTDFTQRVGTVSGSIAGRDRVVGTTYGAIFTSREGRRL